MDLVSLVDKTLSPLKIPVLWQIRPGKFPGISYHFFNESGILFGDGEVERMTVSCQVDIWSKDGHENIKKEVKKLMKKSRFLEPYSYDGYEKEVKLYHTVMVFNYHYKEGETR
ncbi:hypothetical protein SAMN02745784_02921 [Tissierella praeacuta DSM 18095]|uniref:Uncharacterized protein n=1 Tax=Tissierella praeacuta DSM 18095 TaxID=1123404 RepID=A0A1M4Z676_9FIRM|nr:hypothetical protein [Tissierella praeacuta]TCU67500.1 hypothetical protein EV204_11251 [Tissierella praeacuta]SHF13500.1 hypothetical protein SAMN02745784_02921 [Tissierella praeacuta DSM 18095]SUP00599.1 Uncharacterised protein [Tissierella praeacuta]